MILRREPKEKLLEARDEPRYPRKFPVNASLSRWNPGQTTSMKVVKDVPVPATSLFLSSGSLSPFFSHLSRSLSSPPSLPSFPVPSLYPGGHISMPRLVAMEREWVQYVTHTLSSHTTNVFISNTLCATRSCASNSTATVLSQCVLISQLHGFYINVCVSIEIILTPEKKKKCNESISDTHLMMWYKKFHRDAETL